MIKKGVRVLENQVFADIKSVNSEDFSNLSETTRYVNDKNDGRCVTFSVGMIPKSFAVCTFFCFP